MNNLVKRHPDWGIEKWQRLAQLNADSIETLTCEGKLKDAVIEAAQAIMEAEDTNIPMSLENALFDALTAVSGNQDHG